MNDCLKRILRIREDALTELDPAHLVASVIAEERLDAREFDVLAIGKCAARMIDGVVAGSAPPPSRILGCIPRGYTVPEHGEVVEGSHPVPDAASFRAGARALDFVQQSRRPVLLLLSGGGSACAEVPVTGVLPGEIEALNRELLVSGLGIGDVNQIRRSVSAIKGGGLGQHLPPGSFVIIHPDVPAGSERDVASAPAFRDRPPLETVRELLFRVGTPLAQDLASRLVTAGERVIEDPPWRLTIRSDEVPGVVSKIAMRAGWKPLAPPGSLDGSLIDVAHEVHERLRSMSMGDLYIGTGEPLVRVSGDGRGGRCTALAAQLALLALRSGTDLCGTITSTDGVDGKSGLAGVLLDSASWSDRGALERDLQAAIDTADTALVAERLGGAAIMKATGNNLRDLALFSCG